MGRGVGVGNEGKEETRNKQECRRISRATCLPICVVVGPKEVFGDRRCNLGEVGGNSVSFTSHHHCLLWCCFSFFFSFFGPGVFSLFVSFLFIIITYISNCSCLLPHIVPLQQEETHSAHAISSVASTFLLPGGLGSIFPFPSRFVLFSLFGLLIFLVDGWIQLTAAKFGKGKGRVGVSESFAILPRAQLPREEDCSLAECSLCGCGEACVVSFFCPFSPLFTTGTRRGNHAEMDNTQRLNLLGYRPQTRQMQ